MKLRTIYVLFAVLVLVGSLFVVAMWTGDKQPPDTSLYALPGAHDSKNPFEVSDVDRVEIKRARPNAETIVLVRASKTSPWQIEEPHKLRAGAVVTDLVTQILGATRDPEADVPADLKAAGLDPPAEVVTLSGTTGGDKDKKGEARSFQLNVGEASSESSKAVIYVTSPDRPKEILPVRRSSLATVLDTVNDFRDPYLLASAISDYARVKLNLTAADKAKAPKRPLELKKMDGGLWRYTDSLGYDGSAETGETGGVTEPGKRPAGVNGLLKVLSDLRVESADWVQDGATDADLAKYDLDAGKTDVLTVEVDRVVTGKDDTGAEKKVPMTLLVAVGKKVGDKSDRYYAAVKDEEHGTSMARIPTTGPDSLVQEFADPTALRNKTLVALGGFKKPLAVRVTNPSGKLEFLRLKEQDPWRLYRDGKEVTLDQAAVDRLVNQLVQPDQVRSFIDAPDETKLGLNVPAATVEVWVDGVEEEKKPETKDDKKDAEKKDEKKDTEKKDEPKPRLLLKSDKPAAKLTYGAVEEDLAAVKRFEDHTGWTETAVVKASKLLEDQAKAGPLAYYDKALPKFSTGFDLPDKDVTSLELDRPDGQYILSRDKPDAPWAFKKPDEWDASHRKTKVNATQVENVLRTLDSLQARSLVVETPTPEDLDKYGLKAPALKAVVTKKIGDKTDTYTLLFGKDAPDGGVYAQQSQRPMVFEIEKSVVTTLNQDLRDRSVFAVDPAKAKELKLTGWNQNSVRPETLDFVKTGDQWAPKPPDFKADSDKVATLVQGLAHLTAGEIVTKDDKIKAAFDSDADKTALTIEMTVEGEAQPLQLKVVNLTGDKSGLPPEKKGFYAVSANSPNLPGEIFVAPRELFEGPVSKSTYFVKP